MSDKKITKLGRKATSATILSLLVAGGITLTGGTANAAEPTHAVSGASTAAPSGFFDRFRCGIRGGRFINNRCFFFHNRFDRDRFDRDRDRHHGRDRDRFDRDWDRDYGHGRNDDNDRFPRGNDRDHRGDGRR